MSVLKEYKKIKEIMGDVRYNAIEKYLKIFNSRHLLLSDVLFNADEYKRFYDWFNEQISPIIIMPLDLDTFSVNLYQEYYKYDWVTEKKTDDPVYSGGNCYEDLFRDYMESYDKELNKRLNYDSENSMFCVYAPTMRDADSVAVALSKLYKDEKRMIELIKQTKEKYNYDFDIRI